MIGLVLEPSTITTDPLGNHDLDTVRAWVEDLTKLHGACRSPQWFVVTAVPDMQGILGGTGYYPTFPFIQQLLEQTGLKGVYNAGDIDRLVGGILERINWSKRLTDVEEQLLEFVGCDASWDWWPPARALDELVRRSLTLAGAGQVFPVKGVDGTLLASWIARSQGDREVEVSFDVMAAESPVDVPRIDRRKAVCGVFFEPLDVVDTVDAYEVWRRAEDADDVRMAIWLKALSLAFQIGGGEHVRELDATTPDAVLLGPYFVESLVECQAFGGGRFGGVTLERCGRVVAGLVDWLEPFRVSANPNAEQRRRGDGSVAFRGHITEQAEGLRLMAWKKVTGFWELANVGPKHELEIG